MRVVRQPAGVKQRPPVIHDVIFFVALMSTALALGAALAHALELPNKIGLPRDEYFIVQQSYRGWSRLAYLLAVEAVSMVALCVVYRRRAHVLWPAIAALTALVGSQILFWTYTFPANAATGNWTHIPANWEILRQEWEYSHAAGAGLQVIAMAALIVAALLRARR